MMPPAEQQKHLFTKRWRQVQAPQPSEVQLQISLVAQLRLICRRDVVFFHVPNGELRDKRAAAKLKAMGTLPGVADLLFVYGEGDHLRNLYLELKAPGRKMSPEQHAFCARVHNIIDCDYEVASGIDEALGILRKYGIIAPLRA